MPKGQTRCFLPLFCLKADRAFRQSPFDFYVNILRPFLAKQDSPLTFMSIYYVHYITSLSVPKGERSKTPLWGRFAQRASRFVPLCFRLCVPLSGRRRERAKRPPKGRKALWARAERRLATQERRGGIYCGFRPYGGRNICPKGSPSSPAKRDAKPNQRAFRERSRRI